MAEDKWKFCARVIGKSLFLGSMTTAIASVEMSSKFSVKNFSKDQQTLNRAKQALTEYLMIGTVWLIATVLVQSAEYGWFGAVSALTANLVFMIWIYMSYQRAFKEAAQAHNLQH
jgi:hypothetical protein